MITLYVLGSGSRGNCCAVESEGVALLIDAGFSAREVERRAATAGLDLSLIAGIALTHEHGDHACGASLLARRLQVPVLTAPGTWRHLAATMEDAEHRPLGLCARMELVRSPSRPVRPATMPLSRSRSSFAVRRAPASGLHMTWADQPPECAICFAT